MPVHFGGASICDCHGNLKVLEINKDKLDRKTFLPLTKTCLGSNPTVWRMFSILARSIPRRTLIQSVRCLSQQPPVLPTKPPLPASSNNQAKPPLKPASETSTEPAKSTPIDKPVEPKPMSSVPTLDFSPPEPSEESQKTGAMSSKGYKTASERTRRSRTRISLAVLFLALGANAVYMSREWEEEELKMKKMVCRSERFSCALILILDLPRKSRTHHQHDGEE